MLRRPLRPPFRVGLAVVLRFASSLLCTCCPSLAPLPLSKFVWRTFFRHPFPSLPHWLSPARDCAIVLLVAGVLLVGVPLSLFDTCIFVVVMVLSPRSSQSPVSVAGTYRPADRPCSGTMS